MKLIYRASRIFLLSSFLAAVVGGLFSYFILKSIMNNEANEHLFILKENVTNYVERYDHLPQNDIFFSDSCWFTPTKHLSISQLRDTLIYDELEDEMFDYRVLSFGIQVDSSFYSAHIQKPLYETEDLSEALLISFIIIIILMVGSLLLVNYKYSIKLWKPFYTTLNKLSDFKVTNREPISYPDTDIHEFKELHQRLETLTKTVQRDYLSLKSFTENASHEMQTPLAIISTNLELLIQDDNLTSVQMEQIAELMESISKLSKLNQTLLLLTKIENRQFSETKLISLSKVISKKLFSLKPWIEQKGISLEQSIQSSILLELNPYLFDVLLNNLLSNAIKYNLNIDGIIKIKLSTTGLTVSNTGKRLSNDIKVLKQRFQKGNESQHSMGLGLSLVDEICQTYGFTFKYEYQNCCHLFRIIF
ncbi:MAG: HAMP domain-containing histidine kinase [Cytophagales bacterium]|nr:HAMP domain-containing histidine kinase [Cytophagales bacterium]